MAHARTSFLDQVAMILVVIPFSLLGIYFWPLSFALAGLLFMFASATLVRRERKSGSSRIAAWLSAGALVGLFVGTAMVLEGSFRSLGGEPVIPSFAGGDVVLVAIPTGALAILICRQMLRYFSNAPRNYRDPQD